VSDKVGLNLDIEPRHWTAGNAASLKHRQRLEREKKIAKGDVVIRPEHRLAGAVAANRSKARDRDEEATPMPPEPRQPVLSPFARSGKAVSDLLEVFGYPPAVIPEIRPARIHRIKVPADNLPPDPRPQNQPRAARPKESDIYRLRHGVQERLCRSCGQWFTLNRDNFRWRQDRKTGSWNSECRICDNLRRREAAARREARDL
jgi:hypothetical protein